MRVLLPLPAILQVLDLNPGPVIFTHSNARALCDHPRNVPDSVLDRLNRSDAVVMVNFVGQFINCTSPLDASIEDVVQHIEYIARRIGSKHVGLFNFSIRSLSMFPIFFRNRR